MSHTTDSRRSPAIGHAVAVSLLAALAACGGGGSQSDDGSSSGSSASSTSQSEAESSSSTTLSSGRSVSSSVESVYHATTDLLSTGTSSSSARARTYGYSVTRATTQDSSEVITYTADCESSGTATVTISGGTAQTLPNGVLDEGEHYEITYSACKTQKGLVQLDGSIAMDVESVTTDPDSTTVSITFSGLTATVLKSTTKLDGAATLSHSEATSDSTTVATSHVTATKLALSTAWNNRSASLSLTDLDTTSKVTWSGSVPSSSTLQGQYKVSGSAGSHQFDDSVSISSEVAFDSDGNPKSGTWSSVDSKRTVKSSVADSKVSVQVDEGSDGTTDASFMVTVPEWNSSAG